MEWKAISRSYRGPDLYKRRLEFQRKMRQEHPDMPVTFEEQLEAEKAKLENNAELRRAEGLD